MSGFLWQCLAPGRVEIHSEAAVLMSWLNSLFAPSIVCEKVILEHFTYQVREGGTYPRSELEEKGEREGRGERGDGEEG